MSDKPIATEEARRLNVFARLEDLERLIDKLHESDPDASYPAHELLYTIRCLWDPAPPPAAPEPTVECTHEAWEERGGSRRCADCGLYLAAPEPAQAREWRGMRPPTQEQLAAMQAEPVQASEGGLLACPFCGGSAEYREITDGSGTVRCTTPHCKARAPWREMKASAIAAWNRRTTPPAATVSGKLVLRVRWCTCAACSATASPPFQPAASPKTPAAGTGTEGK